MVDLDGIILRFEELLRTSASGTLLATWCQQDFIGGVAYDAVVDAPVTTKKRMRAALQRHFDDLPQLLRSVNEGYAAVLQDVERGLLSKKLVAEEWQRSRDGLEKKGRKVLSAREKEIVQSCFDQVFRVSKKCEPNQRIFRQNDPADGVYLIKQGLVDIIREDFVGNKKIAVLSEGNIFGEMAVVDEQGRSASAYARGLVEVGFVPKEEFKQIIHDVESVDRSVVVLAYLAHTLRERISLVEQVSTRLKIRSAAGKQVQWVDDGDVAVVESSFDPEQTTLGSLIKLQQEQYRVASESRDQMKVKEAYNAFVELDAYYDLEGVVYDKRRRLTDVLSVDEWRVLRDRMLDRGLLAGMLRFGYWNPEHAYRNRRFLFKVMEKSEADAVAWTRFGDQILCQHPGRKITPVDCELAIDAYARAGAGEKRAIVKAYAREKGIVLQGGTETMHAFVDVDAYQPTPGIDDLVNAAMQKLSRRGIQTKNGHIALNFQRGCALEPLSNKPGCTTRFTDLSKYQKLEQFVVGGVNVGLALFDFLSRIESWDVQKGLPVVYDTCYDMQVVSKLNRRGGRLNHGIIEFGFPLVAAMALYDPQNEKSVDYVCGKATELLKATTRRDVEWLVEMKRFAYLLSRIEREVGNHVVTNVFDYYARELAIEEDAKNMNGIVHNRQFVQCFPDIKLVYEEINHASGDINDRVVSAYNKVFAQPQCREIGRGLAADFIAVGLFLTFCYHKKEEIVW